MKTLKELMSIDEDTETEELNETFLTSSVIQLRIRSLQSKMKNYDTDKKLETIGKMISLLSFSQSLNQIKRKVK